jgi:CRP/FNR family transcriptional regulator, cyclic AMP receptor protein
MILQGREGIKVKTDKGAFQPKLSEKELMKIFEQVSSFTLLSLTDKATIYHQGSENPFVFLLTKGQVKLARVNLKGDQLTHAILKQGDVFGPGLSDYKTSESYESAIAKGAVNLYRVSKEDFRSLLSSSIRLTCMVIEMLIARQHFAERRLEGVLFLEVQSRLAMILYEWAMERVDRTTNALQKDFSLTQQELADLIGASRPVVSTILYDLKSRGVIEYTREIIRLIDLEALKEIAKL